LQAIYINIYLHLALKILSFSEFAIILCELMISINE